MEQFIQNILIGVRTWVNTHLDEITEVISSHINELTGRIKTIEDIDPEHNTIITVKVNGTALTPDAQRAVDVEIPTVTIPVTGVKSNDKVLGLDGTELTSTISLTYDSNAKLIKLLGINNAVISSFSTADFVKDGMIDSASMHKRETTSGTVTWTPALPTGVTEPSGTTDGTYLILVWNTDSGKSATFINVSELIDVYSAGTGLSLNDNTFSLNAAQVATIGGVKVANAETSGITLDNDGSISIVGPTVENIVAFLDSDDDTFTPAE